MHAGGGKIGPRRTAALACLVTRGVVGAHEVIFNRPKRFEQKFCFRSQCCRNKTQSRVYLSRSADGIDRSVQPFAPIIGSNSRRGVFVRRGMCSVVISRTSIGFVRAVDRLRRENIVRTKHFHFAGMCMRSEGAKKNLIKMTRYSYPGGGKSISSLSLSLSRRQPSPPSPARVPAPHPILGHSGSAPPRQTHSATHRRATPPHSRCPRPRALRSQNSLVSNYPRGLPPPHCRSITVALFSFY